MTSVCGHMMTLEFEDGYKKWHECDPEDLFTAPIRKTIPEDMENIAKTITREARKCKILILWLDCDREGEGIAAEVCVCLFSTFRLSLSI